jgi:rubrerythrin
MTDEISELLKIAMDREIVSQSFYIAGQKKTSDQGAIQLMKELAEQEQLHYRWIKDFKDGEPAARIQHKEKIQDLMISQYLVDVDISEGTTIQDVITAAMKREQRAVEFYSLMQQVLDSQEGHKLCDRLAHEELHHKQKLETLYDELLSREN